MKSISIKQAKGVRENLNLSQIVIFGISEDGSHHVVTHGKTKVDSEKASEFGNKLKKSMGWPPEFCNIKPLERICNNCSFWKIRKYDHSERIPESFQGHCYMNPEKIERYEKEIACSQFEPNK